MQLSIFDAIPDTPTLVCAKPTRNYPDGRTGTAAGYDAHVRAKDKACEACSEARRVRHKEWRDSLNGERREEYLSKQRKAMLKYSEANPEKVAKANKASLLKRRKAIRKLKEQPCMDCGKTYPYPSMEFDHVRGDKVEKISLLYISAGMERLKEEIDKCDLVCSNCHMERTYTRLGAERAYARPRSWRNREIIAESKKKPCADCNSVFPHYVMEFDHVRGEKLFNIGGVGANSKTEDLVAEMAKCEVVCGNCHAVRTHIRMNEKEVAYA